MKPKVLIIYISTGLYNKMRLGFLASLSHFCPGIEKGIIYFSDEFQKLFEYCDVTSKWVSITDRVVNVAKFHIDHEPWPLVALQKFHYIKRALEAMDEVAHGYTHVCYFNSNIKFVKDVEFNEFFTEDRLTACIHHAFDFVGRDPNKLTYGKPVDPKSAAHIPINNYTYSQSSVFGGPIELMHRACIDIIKMTNYDLAHNRIPCFHDESYWNKYLWMNPDLVYWLDQNYNMDEVKKGDYGFPNAKILMRDSSLTQYKYKDRFHETEPINLIDGCLQT